MSRQTDKGTARESQSCTGATPSTRVPRVFSSHVRDSFIKDFPHGKAVGSYRNSTREQIDAFHDTELLMRDFFYERREA